MLNTPYLGQFRNAQIIQFYYDLLGVTNDYNTQDLKIETQCDNLKVCNDKMDILYKVKSGSEYTPFIETEDKKRRNVSQGVEGILHAYMKFTEEDYVNAANKLYRHWDKYPRKIWDLEYNEKTRAIIDIIDFFRNTPDMFAAVTLLGLAMWLDKLEEINNEFVRLYKLRVEEEKDKPQGNMEELRAESEELYAQFKLHIESQSVANPSPDYDEIFKKINSYIDSYNSAHRKSHNPDDDYNPDDNPDDNNTPE